MTEYAILHKDEKTGGWHKMEFSYGWKVPAASAKGAIRRMFDSGCDPGEYVAIPARSWQPVKVAVETALKFS